MSPARSMLFASTLAVDSASEPASAGSETRIALAAPIASAVRSPDTCSFGRGRFLGANGGGGRVGETTFLPIPPPRRRNVQHLAPDVGGLSNEIGEPPPSRYRRRRWPNPSTSSWWAPDPRESRPRSRPG